MKELIYRSLGHRLQNYSTFFKSLDIQKEFGKIKIRNGGSDIRVFKQIFFDEVYNFFPQEFDPKIIVDAGSNVGYSPIWFSKKFPRAKVIAIEPEKENFKILKANSIKYPNVNCIEKALWYEKTILKIFDSGSGSWGFQTHKVEDKKDGNVETITIQEILNKMDASQIDLLKIDIEGAEFELFKFNADKWLNYIKMIMIETHDNKKPGCTAIIDQMVLPLGFKKFETKELKIYIK